MSRERLILLCALAWIGFALVVIALDYLAKPVKRRFVPDRRSLPRSPLARLRERRDAQDEQVRQVLLHHYDRPSLGFRHLLFPPRPVRHPDDDAWDGEWDEAWDDDAIARDGDLQRTDAWDDGWDDEAWDDEGTESGSDDELADEPVLIELAGPAADLADPADDLDDGELITEDDLDDPTDDLDDAELTTEDDLADPTDDPDDLDDAELITEDDLADPTDDLDDPDDPDDLDEPDDLDDPDDAELTTEDDLDDPDDLSWVDEIEGDDDDLESDDPEPGPPEQRGPALDAKEGGPSTELPPEVVAVAVAPTADGTTPSATTVRRRFWTELAERPSAASLGSANVMRMRRGASPRRYNPVRGNVEPLQISQIGGLDAAWPDRLVDPFADDPDRRP